MGKADRRLGTDRDTTWSDFSNRASVAIGGTLLSGLLVAVGVIVVASGCAGQRSIPLPTVSGPIPITSESHPFNGAMWQKVPIDLSDHGYVEQEYYVTGGAHVYDWVPGSDYDLVVLDAATGAWLPYEERNRIEPTEYTTRITVRRPDTAERFSGRVVVEIINMSAGYDWTAVWGALWEQILKQGDVYVGVTSKPNVIPGMVKFDADRYGRLAMPNPLSPDKQACGHLPGDPEYNPNLSKLAENGLAWDILTQVGVLLKSDDPDNPLGRAAERVYLTGESQSGGYLSRYFRWFTPHAVLPDGAPVYDGYLAEAGGTGTRRIAGLNQCATEINPLPDDDPQRQIPARGLPLFVVHAEWDFPLAEGRQPSERKPNANTTVDKFMMWEVAGASHGWTWQYDYSDAAPQDVRAAGYEPGVFVCGADQPEINLYMVEKAAYVALDRWVTTGVAPPAGDYIETQDGAAGPVRDPQGNAIGGVRLPEMVAPIATYTGLYAPGPDCSDAVKPFDQAMIEELYPQPGEYLDAFAAAAKSLVQDGFLLEEDSVKLIHAAERREQLRAERDHRSDNP